MSGFPDLDSMAFLRSDWVIADVRIPFEMASGTCLYSLATPFFSWTFLIRLSAIAKHDITLWPRDVNDVALVDYFDIRLFNFYRSFDINH